MAPPPTNLAARKPVPNLIDGDDERPPALPPRTGTGLSAGSNGRARNLLDDDEPGDMKGLDGWEVLRPGG